MKQYFEIEYKNKLTALTVREAIQNHEFCDRSEVRVRRLDGSNPHSLASLKRYGTEFRFAENQRRDI